MNNIEIYPLDKQINVAIKILKLLEAEQVTFSEFNFINTLVNDNIKCQRDEIELRIFGRKIYKCDSADHKTIKYQENG